MIVDRLTKSAHFLLIKVTHQFEKLAALYIGDIVRLPSTPVIIVFDRNLRFVSQFWKSLEGALGTTLNFCTAIHPQIDGESE